VQDNEQMCVTALTECSLMSKLQVGAPATRTLRLNHSHDATGNYWRSHLMQKPAAQALTEKHCARDPRWNGALAVGRARSVRHFRKKRGLLAVPGRWPNKRSLTARPNFANIWFRSVILPLPGEWIMFYSTSRTS